MSHGTASHSSFSVPQNRRFSIKGERTGPPSPLAGMKETQAPQHLRDYVQEMVEVGVQLATMLDHMYRFQLQNPDSNPTPPPEVLRDLVAKTLGRHFRTSKKEVQRATNLLRLSSRTIADEIFLFVPDEPDEWDGDEIELSDFQEELELEEEVPDPFGRQSNGDRLH
jgi:hypothetical protein